MQLEHLQMWLIVGVQNQSLTDMEGWLYGRAKEYYSILKGEGILQYATTWMDIEDVMWLETS